MCVNRDGLRDLYISAMEPSKYESAALAAVHTFCDRSQASSDARSVVSLLFVWGCVGVFMCSNIFTLIHPICGEYLAPPPEDAVAGAWWSCSLSCVKHFGGASSTCRAPEFRDASATHRHRELRLWLDGDARLNFEMETVDILPAESLFGTIPFPAGGVSTSLSS